MAKKVEVEFTDDEFASLQTVYATADADATEVVVKNAFINVVKNDVRSYDKRQARAGITYTSMDPK